MDSTAVTLPKKLSNGHRSFGGGSVYDGVFGSPAKIMSGGYRAVEEDYREIFGGGSKSSIPFLDVPELSESKVSVDVRSSKLDYSAIFGGVTDSSFSMRYDELSSEPNRRKKSEEQWTPIDRLSPPEASENSSYTDDSHVFSPEPSNQASDGAKKFKMSYSRVGSDNSNGTSGKNVTTHIAQLNAVQGLAHLIDEVVKPETESVPKGNLSFRASPDVPAETRKQNFGGDVEFRSSPNWFKSNSMEGSVKRGSKDSKIGTGEDSAGSCSPPFFDDEVDINSVAATSAAALRKAIDDAQAKIKVAKEIMERKKAGHGNGTKSFRGSRLKPEADRPKKNKTRELREEVTIPSRASSETGQEKTERLFQVSSGVEVKERVPNSEIPSRADRMWEEAEASSEAEQFYDVEDTGEIWPPTTEVEISHVSVASKGQNVSVPEQATGDFEVEKIVSGVKGSDREADHRQEKAEAVDTAEKFYDEINGTEKTRVAKDKFEDVKGMQSEEKSVQKDEERSNEAFEYSFSQEEIEKRIQLMKGTIGTSDRVSTQDSNVFDNMEEEEEQEEQFSPEAVQAFHETETLERSSMEFVEPAKDGKLLEIRGPEVTRHAERELTSWECSGSGKNGDEFWEQEEECEKEDNVLTFINKVRKNKWMDRKLNSFHLGQQIARVLSHDVEPEGDEKIHDCDSSHKELETVIKESDEWVLATRVMNQKSNVDEGDEDETKASVEEPTNGENDIGSENTTSEKDENDDTSITQEPIVHVETDKTTQESEVGRRSVDELSEAFSENNDSVKENSVMEEKEVQEAEYFPMGSEPAKIMKALEHKTESVSEDERTTGQPASQLEIVHESSEHSEEVASEVEKVEEDKDVKVSEITVNLEDDETSSECSVEQGSVDNGSKMEDTQSPEHGDVELDEEMRASPSREKDHEETKGSQEVEANESQSADMNKENDEASLPVKESTAQEKEIPRRIDAAKERDREIEKGRLAVERAVREARERAFAEARERALAEVRKRVVGGRAATEARQRVAAETREKTGKTSGEVNAKSALAEKASREAKLKAERAAVERATSEVRARALEKAMSSKAAAEARKQNPEHKGSSSTTTSRYPSSNHDVSNSTMKSNGASEESAQRCKARFERHQRISERAQKALAEMNRRDLVAQKEQAERNRLAETLDSEVKRWSNGKEGNLRALLSTLQYILGPDSGWQPIPLTDVIKSAAVKKAYRKATLFVHPDKLQQRGANIQQKYTCEKVFDLLKEAWNKFNVEER